MSDLTVAAIRRRLKTKVADLGGYAPSRLKPADAVEIANDERRLGFPFPPLMKRLYAEIGNGGFGPGYGLIGLTNGVPDDLGQTVPVVYEQLRGARSTEPGWDWPGGLLPICHWGCAIMSCVDCADGEFRMRIFDPNTHDDRNDWTDCFFEEDVSFEAWMAAWASGVDLWDLMYGEKGKIVQILSDRFGQC